MSLYLPVFPRCYIRHSRLCVWLLDNPWRSVKLPWFPGNLHCKWKIPADHTPLRISHKYLFTVLPSDASRCWWWRPWFHRTGYSRWTGWVPLTDNRLVASERYIVECLQSLKAVRWLPIICTSVLGGKKEDGPHTSRPSGPSAAMRWHNSWLWAHSVWACNNFLRFFTHACMPDCYPDI